MSKTIIKPIAPAAKRKASTTQAPGLDARHAADVEDENAARAYFAKLKADFKLSWTREKICGAVLGLITAACSGYVLGSLLGMLTVAVMTATSSLFLTMMIYIVGFVLVSYASGTLGGVVYEYVACGAAREHVALISNTVRGWFGAKPALA